MFCVLKELTVVAEVDVDSRNFLFSTDYLIMTRAGTIWVLRVLLFVDDGLLGNSERD